MDDTLMRDDTYRLFVPIEDHDLLKSVEVDENGDYIVKGVMTSEDKDEEDDSITPEGMDCSYFLEKGWIKYEHGNRPEQFIGEPIEVKVGQFEHPTLLKLVKGILIKGRLFAQRELARQAVKAIEDLQKSNTKRKMGWSIEGNVRERDRKSGKIVKSVLRNVVLTMNPVNTLTWAELSKSFAKNHELTIDMEPSEDIKKAMDTGAAAPIAKQSLEGTAKEEKEDEIQKFIRLFRQFAKSRFLKKSLKKRFVASTEAMAGMTAYSYALEKGLDNEEAYKFASYIAKRHEVLKSLFVKANLGGEKCMEDLAKLLDADLEELQKAIEMDDSEDENPEKSVDDDEEEGEGEEGAENEGEEEEDNESSEDDEDDGEEEKSLKTDFAKSLAENDENRQAFEVSSFLLNLADEIGYSMDGVEKSMKLVVGQQSVMTKALMSMGELVKGLSEELKEVKAENAELKKSFDDMLSKPIGRKSAVSTREIATISKSMGAGDAKNLTRAQAGEVLIKAFESGKISGSTVARFEAGIGLYDLGLPNEVKTELGL